MYEIYTEWKVGRSGIFDTNLHIYIKKKSNPNMYKKNSKPHFKNM